MYEVHGIQVNEDVDEAKGRYACEVYIRSQEREVVLDFVSIIAGNPPQGQLISRIFLNKIKAEELCQTLQQNLRNWEKMKFEMPYADTSQDGSVLNQPGRPASPQNPESPKI